MYLDAGTTFRLVLKNPTDKDNVVQTRGATEQIVLSDIGHGEALESKKEDNNTNNQVAETPQETDTPVIHQHIHQYDDEDDLDDGKVDIFVGSKKSREITKYNGPAPRKVYSINNSILIPNVEIK